MPILGVPVSLGEVLENSAPLREADIWGVLCQGAEAIQDLFFRGEAIQDGIANFVISLDTLLLCPNGRAQLSESSQAKNIATFIAPEIHTGILMSEAAIEKIYVYSLGKTLQVAIDYSLKKDPSLTISRNLESILNAMCAKNPSLRIALIHVLEACSLQSQRRTVTRTPSFSQSVARLAKTVTGTQTDLSYWSYDYYNTYNYNNSGSSSDQSRQSTLNRRSLKNRRASRRNRRRNGSGRSQRDKDRSRSRSPARSSSRSRSRSYSNAGNVENVDPKDDKTTDTSSTSSQSMVRTNQATASPKRRPSINSRPSSLYIPPRSDTSQCSFSSNSSSKHRRSPSSLFGAKTDVASHLANTPAYEKYLRLKDRQRKLQALQRNEDAGFWASDNSDGFSDNRSDTRSVTSGISVMQGSFLPDLSSGYGQDMALKLGPRSSDRDSIVSSEMSFFQHDPNAMRSEIDPTPMYAAPSLKSMTEHALHHSTNHPAAYSQVPRSPSSSILSTLGDESVTGNKEYNGPEFICRGRKPLVKLNMPLSGESLKNPANARRVIIVLLNGQKIEAMCDPSTTGKQLFQTVISHTSLHEIQSYFGLTYIHDGEHFFLDQDTKLHKMAPDGWREGGKGHATITFILFFRIKYYGTTVLDTNHQHLLYLQLRQDILEERLECDENRALSLAAFALQIECGSYQKEMMGRNYFVPEYYFSKRILQLYGTSFIRDHTPDAHRSICGLSEDDAMVKFIRLVQELPEYGTHFHKVYKTKNENPSSMSWIGIGAHSLIIAENLKKERVIVDRQPWATVDKLSFKGKRLTVQIKPDPTTGGKPSKVYFYTNSHRKGRYLLQMSTDQHKFQLKTLTHSTVMSALQNNKPLPEPPMFADIEFADLEEEDEDDEIYQISSPITPLPAEVPLHLSMKRPIYSQSSNNLHDSLLSIPHELKQPHRLHSSVHSLHNLTPSPLPARLHVPNGTRGAHCLTGSSRSLLSPPSPPPSPPYFHVKYSNDNPHAQLRAGLSPVPPSSLGNNSGSTTSISSVSHIIDFSGSNGLNSGSKLVSLKEVVLKKDNSSSIGVGFVAGKIPDTGKNGKNGHRHIKQTPAIFVRSITPGGPADLNGQVKLNDQVLAVNGLTVTGSHYQDIIKRIKQSGNSTTVQLLLLQRSHITPNKRPVLTSNETHTRLLTSPSRIYSTLPKDQSGSGGANDFASRTSLSLQRHSPGSTRTYFNNHYIPEHHVSVPNILDALQEPKPMSARFSSPTIISGSPQSLQECKRRKYVSTGGIHHKVEEKQNGNEHFRSMNSLSISEFPQFKVTPPPNSSLPTFMPSNNQEGPSEYRSTPLASSTPATSPTTQRDKRNVYRRMSLESAKRLLSKQNKQAIFREKTPSVWKQRQEEKFYDCILSKQDGSLGLNIIGGTNTKTELGGVYVKSLRANGAAEKNGTIYAGDRIVQINSINLEEVQHEEAVKILQEAPERCLLVLGRRQVEPKKPVSRSSPIGTNNEMVPPKEDDTYSREMVKEDEETEVKMNWKHGKLSQESLRSEIGCSAEDSIRIGMELVVCQEKDGKSPKRTIPNQTENRQATLESPESHGVQQGRIKVPLDTRKQGAEMEALNDVENIHSGASPHPSEGLQLKDNVPFTNQESGATKIEGNPVQGLEVDPTLSDGRNKDTLNKVIGNDCRKHIGTDACLQQEPPDSVLSLVEEQRRPHAKKDDSPINQNTTHGSDGPTCSSGGISHEDTSNNPQVKKTLTASKLEAGEAVLLDKDLVESQSKSVPEWDPTSLLAIGRSTQDEATPNTADPTSYKTGENSMQQCSPLNIKGLSNETRKAEKSAAKINEDSLIKLALRNTQQIVTPMAIRSKMMPSESMEDRMERVPRCLQSGPNSDIQDQNENPFPNLSWLWEVPLVRSPGVINKDLLKDLMLQLENSLHSNKYLEEFQLIKQESLSNSIKTKVALLPENKARNRCQENVPYDNSRVLLSKPQSYINASHIKVDIGQTRYNYIACQSPLSNTMIDFWRMVWETKAPTIVMLSLEVECGRNKCFRYWPDSKDQPWNIEEKYQVVLIERQNLPGFDVRLLQLSCQSSGKQHHVMQFMYKVWPFRGTPSSPVSLLQLTQAVQFCHNAVKKNQMTSNVERPTVIHCANGCGRSAVFITVYTAILHIQNNIHVDVFALVKNLRLQRLEMVKTKAEYRFCYTAVIRALYELICPYGELVTQETYAGQ